MYKYKLTRRGKAVIFVLSLMLFTLIGTAIHIVSANIDEPYSETGQVDDSKAIAPVDVNQSTEQSNTLMIAPEELASYADKKIIFLTFDDGPTAEVTPKILEILAQYDVKATFFVLGVNIEKNESLLQDIYNSGHAIGNHTYSHKYKFIYSNVDNFSYEITLSEDILKKALGDQFKTRLFRFPGGSFKTSNSLLKDYITQAGYVSIDWNTITGDGESSNRTSQELLNRAVATAKGRNHLTLLMHDSMYKRTTVEALPSIIEYFKSQGYTFAIYK